MKCGSVTPWYDEFRRKRAGPAGPSAGRDEMQVEFDEMRTAIAQGDVIGYIERDESLLTTLYDAGGNPVLVNLIQWLWQQCRGYKIVGAQAALDAVDSESLWRYQEALVSAAGEHDVEMAASTSDASLLEASQRIKEMLAAHQDAQTAAQDGVPGGG